MAGDEPTHGVKMTLEMHVQRLNNLFFDTSVTRHKESKHRQQQMERRDKLSRFFRSIEFAIPRCSDGSGKTTETPLLRPRDPVSVSGSETSSVSVTSSRTTRTDASLTESIQSTSSYESQERNRPEALLTYKNVPVVQTEALLDPKLETLVSFSIRETNATIPLSKSQCISRVNPSLRKHSRAKKQGSPLQQTNSDAPNSNKDILEIKGDIPFSHAEGRRRTLLAEKEKDDAYWDRRRRNNLAARKSRNMRRAKELEVIKNMQELQATNDGLKVRVQALTDSNLAMEAILKSYKQLLERNGEAVPSLM